MEENRQLEIITEFWPRGLTLCGADPRAFLEELVDRGYHISVIDEHSQSMRELDINDVLDKCPVEPHTDIFFTNLYCSRRAA